MQTKAKLTIDTLHNVITAELKAKPSRAHAMLDVVCQAYDIHRCACVVSFRDESEKQAARAALSEIIQAVDSISL